MTKIATILVTYNGEKWIKNCIDSINASTIQSDIFLVDNYSSDDTLSIINKENCFEIISLKENKGFGYANNLALEKALLMNYDYYFLVNQDVMIEKKTISQLINFHQNNSAFGIVCPIQYDGKGNEIDFSFMEYILKSKDIGNYYEANFANAAAWLISKQCLETVGLFHPYFLHYGEDKDYCNRVLYHKFKIAILKNTKVLHDRNQWQSLEKAIRLGKIKLLTIFLNPNLSSIQSTIKSFINVFGITKYILIKHKSIESLTAFPILLLTFLKHFKNSKGLNYQKNQSKQKFALKSN